MHAKYLGDSYDIVKRFWAEQLMGIAPLFAHPRFIPPGIAPAFVDMVRMPIFSHSARPTEPFGLFLDPHTGIPLPTSLSRRATVSHAPLSFIEAEFERCGPHYQVCFDQSHDRGSGLSRVEQRSRKQEALRVRRIASFYYVSHAPFLFAARDSAVLGFIHRRLLDSGLPSSRFEF